MRSRATQATVASAAVAPIGEAAAWNGEGGSMATIAAQPVIRLLIADHQTLFRVALAGMLREEPDIEVVGLASSGRDALSQLPETMPDVVLMDSHPDGLASLRSIATEYPTVRVLILSSREGAGHVVDALRAGASGYLLKDSSAEALACAVRAVREGGMVMSGQAADGVLRLLNGQPVRTEHYDGLTERELEVLTLVAAGTAYKQVARQLRISHKTVRTHVCHIYGKLEMYDRSQVVRYALRKGLVEL
jgi:DNA-binding NarL/FixJ family response regulator